MADESIESKPDWARMVEDVTSRIWLLKACWEETAVAPELHQKMADDLYVPALLLLADFCAAVEIPGHE
jgi:hypothetical protein